jgi:hypothetical protein
MTVTRWFPSTDAMKSGPAKEAFHEIFKQVSSSLDHSSRTDPAAGPYDDDETEE